MRGVLTFESWTYEIPALPMINPVVRVKGISTASYIFNSAPPDTLTGTYTLNFIADAEQAVNSAQFAMK